MYRVITKFSCIFVRPKINIINLLPIMKCGQNDVLPELVEKKYWKEILNILGERRGNAYGVGDDATISVVSEYNAILMAIDLKGINYKYKDEKVKGQYKNATNDVSSLSEISVDSIPRDKEIMLGGTLATHKCDHCHGKGEIRCPSCSGTGVCKQCNGKGYVIQQGNKFGCGSCHGSGWCRECGGSKWVSCKSCNGTGYYQTYRTFRASDKEDTFYYCPVEAIATMISEKGIPTEVLYDKVMWKKHTIDELAYDYSETLQLKIWDKIDKEVADAFMEVLEDQSKAFEKKKDVVLYEKFVHAEYSPLIEVDYLYHNKEYSLFISQSNPAVYCYDSFPGRGSQWIRELFGSIKHRGKDTTGDIEDNYQK